MRKQGKSKRKKKRGLWVRAGSDPNLGIDELPRITSIPPPLPRGTSKDQLFLAALRSGITGGDLLDVELHAYTRRTSSAVDIDETKPGTLAIMLNPPSKVSKNLS